MLDEEYYQQNAAEVEKTFYILQVSGQQQVGNALRALTSTLMSSA